MRTLWEMCGRSRWEPDEANGGMESVWLAEQTERLQTPLCVHSCPDVEQPNPSAAQPGQALGREKNNVHKNRNEAKMTENIK